MVRKGLFLWIVLLSKLLVAAQNTIYPTKAKGKPTKEVLLKLLQQRVWLKPSFHCMSTHTVDQMLWKNYWSLFRWWNIFSHTNWLLIQEGKVSLILTVDYLMIIRSWLLSTSYENEMIIMTIKGDSLSLSCCTPLTKEGGITDKECLDS